INAAPQKPGEKAGNAYAEDEADALLVADGRQHADGLIREGPCRALGEDVQQVICQGSALAEGDLRGRGRRLLVVSIRDGRTIAKRPNVGCPFDEKIAAS